MDEIDPHRESEQSQERSSGGEPESARFATEGNKEAKAYESNPYEHSAQDQIDRDLEAFKRWISVKFGESKLVDIVQMIASVFLVILGVVGAFIYFHQLKTMQGQLTQMQTSVGQTDRLLSLYQQQLGEMQKANTTTGKQFTLQQQQIISQKQALIEFNLPTFREQTKQLSIEIRNNGETISKRPRITVKISRLQFPSLKIIGKPFTDVAVPNELGSISNAFFRQYPIPRPEGDLAHQRETVKVEEFVFYDDGFGNWQRASACWEFIGPWRLKTANVLDGEFLQCGTFAAEVTRVTNALKQENGQQ